MKKRALLTLPERNRQGKRSASILAKWDEFKSIKGSAQQGEFLLYGDIGTLADWGEIGATNVIEFLNANKGRDVTIRINSPGGDVFEGVAIYNALLRHDASVTVNIDGLAASSATIAMMAADTINMASNATVMVHKAWTFAVGSSDDMRKEAEILDGIDANIVATYAQRTGRPADEIWPIVTAETWMTPDQALAEKFIDSITPAKAAEPKGDEPQPQPARAELEQRFAAALQRQSQHHQNK